MTEASGRKILFLATEDWFVRSHFMPLLRRARAEGFEVTVAARGSGADLEHARFVDMPIARRSMHPWDLWREAGALRALVRRENPDIVHVISHRPIVISLIAGLGRGCVFAITGRGYLLVRKKWWMQRALGLFAAVLRHAIVRQGAHLLVENLDDRRWVEGGRPLPDDVVSQMPGAGVDPSLFQPGPEPEGPVVIGTVGRLVRSKGVDVAVEAVQRLRGDGLDVILRVAGEPDALNPDYVSLEEIARWRDLPGVEVLGRVTDIAGFWRGAHIACVPSRGGEGLPRSLLEAAASGKPIVASNVPGCSDFMEQSGAGHLAQPDDVGALTDALRALATDAAARHTMGAAARRRIETAYSEQHAADCAVVAWYKILAHQGKVARLEAVTTQRAPAYADCHVSGEVKPDDC